MGSLLATPPNANFSPRGVSGITLDVRRIARLAVCSRIENRLPGLGAEVAEMFGEWVGGSIKPDRSGRPVRFGSEKI